MSNRPSINNWEWLWDVFRGHALIFLAGALFQLFLFSFHMEWREFVLLLLGYSIAVLLLWFLWENRRHCLKHHNHWILRTAWWDIFPILGMPILGCIWVAYIGETTLQTTIQSGILMMISLGMQLRGILRINRRLTDAFIARLKRVRGAEAAYALCGVNYRGWCLTFAWVTLAMLLYNGGRDYGDKTLLPHCFRLAFLIFCFIVTSIIEVRTLWKTYWLRTGLMGSGRRCMRFLGMLPGVFWISLFVLALEIVGGVLYAHVGWYISMMLAFCYQLLLCYFFHLSSGRPSRLWGWLVIHPVYLLVVSFLCLVLVGTYLFELPFCNLVDTKAPMSLMDAFFTATSAVCVTGMTTIDLTRMSFGGLVVLCCLVQLGALGVMTVSSFFAVLAGQRLGLMGSSLVNRLAGEDRGLLAKRMILRVIGVTLLFEVLGTLIFGGFLWKVKPLLTFKAALGHGFFLSLNSFCNAGFQIFQGGFSVSGELNDTVPMMTSAVLFICGGLGFGVLMSVWRWFCGSHVHAQTPQVRIVLWMTAFLIFVGMVVLLCSEWSNPATLGEMPSSKKILNAFFVASSSRTAGYEVFSPAELNAPAALFTRVLIFIGGAPGSTGGGVRVTTIGVLVLLVWSIIKRRSDVVVGRSSISAATVRQAIAVLFLGLLVVCVGTVMLTFATMGTGITLEQSTFEVLSAMSNVGMTLGITDELNVMGKLVLIVTMFIGRIGFLSILSAASGNVSVPKVRYPEWRVMIG